MKIACCTLEMITLIFLLIVSFNGAFSTLEDQADFTNRPAEELVSAWGQPDEIVAATDVGFASIGMENVEVWSYDDTGHSVVVRGDIVIAVREG